MRVLKIKSYAKINLYLEVLKKREDNYHQIVTLFERISLFDEISIKPRLDKIIRIICNNPALPTDRTNLAYRAAALLMRDFCIGKGVEIKIDKHIPVASGLAGGSSNAASVLLGLNRLWKLNLSKKKLISYGQMLGSDTPFFLSNVAFAIGEGRGDEIKTLREVKKRFWHILVVPKIQVLTKRVYARLDEIFHPTIAELTKSRKNVKILVQMLKQGKSSCVRKSLSNRLEMATFDLYPNLKQLKDMLLDLVPGRIYMSGSGPAMFGIFSSRKEACVLCSKLSKFANCDTFMVRTV